MKRVGTVLVFKPGIPAHEIKEAVAERLGDLLDPAYFIDYDTRTRTSKPVRFHVHEFDDEFGGPVWYIP